MEMMTDERQMITLEALRILEKRLLRDADNMEAFVSKAEQADADLSVWQWREELREIRARLKMLQDARQEVLNESN
jgi:hypothetical protein